MFTRIILTWGHSQQEPIQGSHFTHLYSPKSVAQYMDREWNKKKNSTTTSTTRTYLADYAATQHISPDKSVPTLSHSLSDVGDPKHFQTLRCNFRGVYIKDFSTTRYNNIGSSLSVCSLSCLLFHRENKHADRYAWKNTNDKMNSICRISVF